MSRDPSQFRHLAEGASRSSSASVADSVPSARARPVSSVRSRSTAEVPPRSTTRELEADSNLEGRLEALAHDLNNLLTPVVGLSAALEAELEAKLGAGHAFTDWLTDLRVAAESAAQVVRRELRSLTTNSQSVVPLGDALHQSLPLLRANAGEKIRVDLQTTGDLGVLHIDRHGFDSALINLVANAREAIADRGTIRLVASVIHLEAKLADALGLTPGRYAQLKVVDSGSGIPEDLLDRVFEKHFTASSQGRGSGLGLAHVKRFVAESRGAIRVDSKAGQGAEFTLIFPSFLPGDLG